MPGTTGHSYEDTLRKMNGQAFNNPPMGSLSMRSPGDQQLAQRQVENAKTSVLQRAADFLQAMKQQGM
tara:strand:- start:830 stop:1033 length:204 start_codon:yes stop_codon:yes gene_type:complete